MDSTAPESMMALTDFVPLSVTSTRGTSGRPMRIETRTLFEPLKRYGSTLVNAARYSRCHCLTLIPWSFARFAHSRLASKLFDMYSTCDRSHAAAAYVV